MIDDLSLRSRSRWAARICLLVAILLPPSIVGAWIFLGPEALIANVVDPAQPLPQGMQLFAIVAVSLVAPVLVSFALLSARRCFQSFAAGNWFDEDGARALRRFGALYLAASIFGLLLPAFLSVLVTLHYPEGQRVLAWGISTGRVLSALAGFMFWLIGDVLVRAAELAEDNRQII
ncbi:hypothetical protein [Pontivivens insulae]|uniref:DUF2975 domain-containing protein n=1 Tax=Pontivivens insulae TaxID=1639689 RepID=A0A2R8A7P4_9RHOB|nr:hypothetical protein [Pontivivens insulae]RED18353.1 hypothetical protein DFR53_0548 [Pontivivens insulae]SPF28251.1 hypothetical protein POI8812_00549 [Pontivivens insulae]